MKHFKIRSIQLLLFVACNSVAVCHAENIADRLAKLKSVVEKDGRCVFAVAQAPAGKYSNSQILLPRAVSCVGDITIGAGTLSERKGCGAFILNAETLETTPLREFGYNIADNQKCDQGGFEKVMNSTLYSYFRIPGEIGPHGDILPGKGKVDVPVKSQFLQSQGGGMSEPVVVFAEKSTAQKLLGRNSTFEAWFQQERASYAAKVKEEAKRSTASEGSQ